MIGKLFFQRSEPASLRILDALAPLVGGNRLTSVHPPSAMAPGECYAALGDRRLERRQLGMVAKGPAEAEGDAFSALLVGLANERANGLGHTGGRLGGTDEDEAG